MGVAALVPVVEGLGEIARSVGREQVPEVRQQVALIGVVEVEAAEAQEDSVSPQVLESESAVDSPPSTDETDWGRLHNTAAA